MRSSIILTRKFSDTVQHWTMLPQTVRSCLAPQNRSQLVQCWVRIIAMAGPAHCYYSINMRHAPWPRAGVYRCVRRTVVRDGFESWSDELGTLEVGDEVCVSNAHTLFLLVGDEMLVAVAFALWLGTSVV
eukprot:SAG11_NODE_128_length_15542_cov_6.432105_15_plen_130_part_00